MHTHESLNHNDRLPLLPNEDKRHSRYLQRRPALGYDRAVRYALEHPEEKPRFTWQEALLLRLT